MNSKSMSYKWPNIGNEKAIDFLEKNIANKSLANSYIFSGLRDLGKFSLAKDFARNIFISENPELSDKDNFLENYADFYLISRLDGKKNISIEQIRELIKSLSSSSFMDSYRVVIIKDADNLNQNSANALLKLLEEFKDKFLVVLTVNDIGLIPKTIVSRSQIINLYPMSFDQIYSDLKEQGLSPSEAKNIARLSMGRPVLARKFFEEKDFYIDYKELCHVLVDFLSYNFVERVSAIDSICRFDSSLGSNFNIIEIWQGVIRDLNFLLCHRPDLVQNEFIIDKLKDIDFADSKYLTNSSEILKTALSYLRSNMTLKSVLDYVAINI